MLGALLGARAAAAAPSAAGFSVSYTDAGLVGVTGTCSNGEAGGLTEALASCFKVVLFTFIFYFLFFSRLKRAAVSMFFRVPGPMLIAFCASSPSLASRRKTAPTVNSGLTCATGCERCLSENPVGKRTLSLGTRPCPVVAPLEANDTSIPEHLSPVYVVPRHQSFVL